MVVIRRKSHVHSPRICTDFIVIVVVNHMYIVLEYVQILYIYSRSTYRSYIKRRMFPISKLLIICRF